MSKTPHTPEAVAQNVLRLVKEDERSLEWLSRKSFIPYSTLRAQLIEHPNRLNVRNLGHIAEALGRPLTDLVTTP